MERDIPLLRRLLLRRRTRYSLLIALAIVAALAIAVLLRKAAPPEAARLLPESDAIFYVDIKLLRLATHFDRSPIEQPPGYQHFLEATGIVPERDVDAAAVALHRVPAPPLKDGRIPSDIFTSEVFVVRFDVQRLTQYLASTATARESYAGRVIYSVPVDGQLLRIALLGYDTIAASNMPTTEQIHSMLDRYSASASPFSGSSLLNARYREVPLLSGVWAIGHIGLPLSQNGRISVFGISLPLPADTTFVASLRYVGSVRLRIEEIAVNEAAAQQSADALNQILGFLKPMLALHADASPSSGPTDLEKFANTLAIEQRRDRVILTGSLSIDLFRRAGQQEAQPATAK